MRRLAKYGTRFFIKPLDFVEFEAWLMLAELNPNYGINSFTA